MKEETIRKRVFSGIFKRPCFGDWNCYIITGILKKYADSCPYPNQCKVIKDKEVDRILRNNRKQTYGVGK